MDTNQIQELCESIAINTLNGGLLAGFVFRHNDTPKTVKPDMVTITAEGPVPQLDGPGGYLVSVEIELKSKTSGRNAALYGEALRRITHPATLRAAALSAGMATGDDFYVMNEDIEGDRSETQHLRKRTITVPFWIKVNR